MWNDIDLVESWTIVSRTSWWGVGHSSSSQLSWRQLVVMTYLNFTQRSGVPVESHKKTIRQRKDIVWQQRYSVVTTKWEFRRGGLSSGDSSNAEVSSLCLYSVRRTRTVITITDVASTEHWTMLMRALKRWSHRCWIRDTVYRLESEDGISAAYKMPETDFVGSLRNDYLSFVGHYKAPWIFLTGQVTFATRYTLNDPIKHLFSDGVYASRDDNQPANKWIRVD